MSSIGRVISRVKESVRNISAYHLEQPEFLVKLNQNESPYDLPDWLKQEILAEFHLRAWNRYPSFTNETLRGRLAELNSVATENVLIGNGSNELLQVLVNVFLRKGRSVLTMLPAFQLYKQLSVVAEAQVIELDFASDWSFPVDNIVKTLSAGTIDICFLCAPNNPTGTSLSVPDLERILKATPGLVVVDQAYGEFAGISYLGLLPGYANLVITRTFSKAIGLASLRIGYALAHSELISEMHKALLPYNLNAFSSWAALGVLRYPEVIEDTVSLVREEKDRLVKMVQGLGSGCKIVPSSANFFLLQTGLSGRELYERLLRHGVLIRDVSRAHKRLQNMVRVTVGSRRDNDAFLHALKAVFEEVS